MYRASLLRVKSLLSLSKVCCSSRNSSDSIKSLDNLLRNLSTAPERLYFQNPNEHPTENSSDFSSNIDGRDSWGQNARGFQQNPNGQNLNPSEGFSGGPRYDYMRKPDGEIRRLDGLKDGLLRHNQSELYHKCGGVSKDPLRDENQRYATGEIENFNGVNGKIDGNLQKNPTRVCSEGTQGSWPNRNGIYGETAGGFQPNLNGFSQNRSGDYRESTKIVFEKNPIQKNGGVGSAYDYSNGFTQQNSSTVHLQNSLCTKDGFYGGNTSMQNQSWGSYHGEHGETLQNASSFNSQSRDQSEYQENLNLSQTRNMARFQQNQNVRNIEMYSHHSPNHGVGQYQTSFNYQNWTPASQVSTNSAAQVGLGQASDDNAPESKDNGSIEELDDFCKEGKLKEAVEVLGLLVNKGSAVNLPRLLQLVQLCGEAEALQESKAIHEHIITLVSPVEVSTYNKIIEMYSKCGSMDDALSLFNKMPEKNLETWDTMIRWFAKNGLGEDAIDIFSRFKEEGNKPDGQIFLAVFSACAVLGDVNEGLLHFESMFKDNRIVPSMEHYVGVVEMLAATGYLDEALDFIEKMPMEPCVDVWETLMNLSRVHGNLELGDRCAEIVEQLDATRLNEQSKAGLIPVKASDLLKEKQKKMLGSRNPLETRSRTHEYRAGDTSHPENDRIYALLRGLKAHMVEMGYIPETRVVLHDVDQESKEEALLSHSERLAFAHGLLTTSARSSIRVIKNLRVCVDCHNALKIISKIVGRQFIMRDAKRFHHLNDGVCSCRDYW